MSDTSAAPAANEHYFRYEVPGYTGRFLIIIYVLSHTSFQGNSAGPVLQHNVSINPRCNQRSQTKCPRRFQRHLRQR